MMKALILMRHPEEGPGLLEDILRRKGWGYQKVRLWKGEEIPEMDPFHLFSSSWEGR